MCGKKTYITAPPNQHVAEPENENILWERLPLFLFILTNTGTFLWLLCCGTEVLMDSLFLSPVSLD